MKFTIKERLLITNFIPDSGDMITMLLSQSIVDKTKVTPREIQEYRIEQKDSGIRWNPTVPDNGIDIKLESSEINLLKDGYKKLDEEKRITRDLLGLCIKIKEL